MKDSVRTSIDIPKDLLKEVKMFCVINDISIKEFVVVAIEEKLKK